jgi:hypothetical protein
LLREGDFILLPADIETTYAYRYQLLREGYFILLTADIETTYAYRYPSECFNCSVRVILFYSRPTLKQHMRIGTSPQVKMFHDGNTVLLAEDAEDVYAYEYSYVCF